MAKFIDPIKVSVYRSSRVLEFKTTQDIKRWLTKETPFWEGFDSNNTHPNLKYYWEQQSRFYSDIRQKIREFEALLSGGENQNTVYCNEAIQFKFGEVSSGKVITSDCDIYPAIVNSSESRPDVAGFLYAMANSEAEQNLGKFTGLQIPYRTLLDLILLQTRGKGTKDWLLPQRKELADLRDESEAALTAIRESFEEQEQSIKGQKEREEQAHRDRETEWGDYKKKKETEWASLKKVYDEQLALAAPTQYWKERAENHKVTAVKFARAFGAFLLLALGLFVWLGRPYISSASGNETASLILTLVPIAIPTFAGIWILRILGRLFSENLQMMQDAKERQTMVKTFLALMREDKSAKPLINDNDRILILHSLFRPSSVTAVDDAPPVHWFDILTNKGGKFTTYWFQITSYLIANPKSPPYLSNPL